MPRGRDGFLFTRRESRYSVSNVTNKKYDLVILAAGMGSRFGGIKQVQPVGPHGELIIEYSASDALRAGFDRLILVIRKDIEADFRAVIGRRLEQQMDVRYVYQELDTCIPVTSPKRKLTPDRVKPWGTAHATLVAQSEVRGPFAVINADDFYGASAYRTLAGHFATSTDYAMVGYPLNQTLSEHGAVSRGLCTTDGTGRLQNITEITKIEKAPTGARYADKEGQVRLLSGDEIVSMNFWGFTPTVFGHLDEKFRRFLAEGGDDPKAEIYLPTVISELNESDIASVVLHRSTDAWFGLTYQQDLASAQANMRQLIAAGHYPAPLWPRH
jgi:UTP-glucose-1-phosphate uridylyltransferase